MNIVGINSPDKNRMDKFNDKQEDLHKLVYSL